MHSSNEAAPDLLLLLCIEAATTACDASIGTGSDLADHHQCCTALCQLIEALAFVDIRLAVQCAICAARGKYHAVGEALRAQTQRSEERRGRNNGGSSNRRMFSRGVAAGGVTCEPAIYGFAEADVA